MKYVGWEYKKLSIISSKQSGGAAEIKTSTQINLALVWKESIHIIMRGH